MEGALTVVAVVVAAGRGARLGGGTPKQFLHLAGAPMVAHAIAAVADAPSVDEVVLVVPPGDPEPGRAVAAGFPKVRRVVAGGETRRASVAAGLAACPAAGFVVVHDAARPLATCRLTEAVLAAARRSGAAVPAVPVADTLKEVAGGAVRRTLDREEVLATQTPQAFRADWLRRAHAEVADGPAATDDAALVEALGLPVEVVPGEPDNLKVTRPADVALAEFLLGRRG